jgi:hypothetical protein
MHALTPSVVVRLTDAQGRDVADARVLVDGLVVATTLNGRPIEVDPGVHTFRFEPVGAPASERRVVIVEGEKDRILAEAFAPLLPAPVPPTPTDSSKPPPGERHVPAAVYVLGGVGAVALGGFIYIAASSQSEYSGCARQGCSSSVASSLDTRRVLAWSSLGVAVAAVGAGVSVFVLSLPHTTTRVGVAPVSQGGLVTLSAEL